MSGQRERNETGIRRAEVAQMPGADRNVSPTFNVASQHAPSESIGNQQPDVLLTQGATDTSPLSTLKVDTCKDESGRSEQADVLLMHGTPMPFSL